jgi:nuclear factor related to kappa-B-binding protein
MYPDKPWVYFNGDGSTSIVGPVTKKKSTPLNQKAREHKHMFNVRPAMVTLLCLARDAASRLPNGIGTRADIIDVIT